MYVFGGHLQHGGVGIPPRLPITRFPTPHLPTPVHVTSGRVGVGSQPARGFVAGPHPIPMLPAGSRPAAPAAASSWSPPASSVGFLAGALVTAIIVRWVMKK